MSTNLYLVLLDTDRIKDYIFATNKLKEISGASRLLDKLNVAGTLSILRNFGAGNYESAKSELVPVPKTVQNDGLDWEVIYLGGGSGKILFKDENRARDFCAAAQKKYATETISASITAHVEKWAMDSDSFKQVLERGEEALRLAKNFGIKSENHFGGLYCCPCTLCGELSATGYDQPIVNPENIVCEACAKKRESAKSGEEKELANFDPQFPKVAGRQDIKTFFRQEGKDNNIVFPDDLNEIGKRSSPPNYVALLYADGNGMGRKLETLLEGKENKYSKYRRFSDLVEKASRYAIVNSILEVVPPQQSEDGKLLAPVEFILAGGDDLIVIVPADAGAQVAIKFTELFERYFQCGLNGKFDGWPDKDFLLTMSVGMVITKSSYPIRDMVDRGQELLKSAKKKFRTKPDVSAIDFAAIKSPAVQSISQLRSRELSYLADDRSRMHCYARPYERKDFEKLVKRVQGFRNSDFPKNKLQSFYEILFSGKWQAMLDACTLVTRLPAHAESGPTSPREAMLDFWQDQKLDSFPWRRIKADEFEAPLSDLIELYEFIH
jgi:hypothetical protein